MKHPPLKLIWKEDIANENRGWVYADEITACEDEGRDDEGRDNYVVTASRVLVKTLPRQRVGLKGRISNDA